MGGSQPTNTTQQVTTKTELPEWYQGYLQNVMGRAVGAAGEPYQPYTGARVAGLTPDQQKAYSNIAKYQGIGTDLYGGAEKALTSAYGVDFAGGAGAGDANIESGIGMLGDAGVRDTASAILPYAGEGTGLIRASTQGSALANANPYIAASVAPMGLGAAQPYLAGASGNVADVSAYMNPYDDAVVKRIAELGGRNLSENIIPGIGDQFVKAGQFGSGRQADITGRAIRDTQDSILAQQAQALQSGYGAAQQAKSSDLGRYAGLAGTAGGLGTAQQQALLGAGQAAGQLSSADLARLQAAGVDISQIGSTISAAQATDAARALAAGQNIGQLGLGRGQLGLSAAQAQAQNYLATAAGAQSLGDARQQSVLKDAAALEQAGAAQQGQAQRNLDVGYGDFLEQRNAPWDTIGKLSNVVQGLPINTSTSGTTTTSAPGPSTASQVAGLGIGVAGLANSGIFKKSGGAVRKPRQKHSYGNLPKRGIAIAA